MTNVFYVSWTIFCPAFSGHEFLASIEKSLLLFLSLFLYRRKNTMVGFVHSPGHPISIRIVIERYCYRLFVFVQVSFFFLYLDTHRMHTQLHVYINVWRITIAIITRWNKLLPSNIDCRTNSSRTNKPNWIATATKLWRHSLSLSHSFYFYFFDETIAKKMKKSERMREKEKCVPE
jgi:hypothetical protein